MTYFVCYRKGTDHATSKGDIAAKTGDGVTWSALSTIYSDAMYDARDPNITKLANGNLIVSFFLYNHLTQANLVDGVRVIQSGDNGATWGAPVTINDGFTNHSACCAPVIELADGTLLLAYYGKDTGDANRSVRLMSSTDGGATWGSEVIIAEAAGTDYAEPNLLLLANGNILCLIRLASGILYSTSTDNGATWSAAALAFAGTGAPHVIQLTDGQLVCCYRNYPSQYAAMRTSADNGATWSNEFVFDTTTYTSMMYATPIENSAGNVAIAYAIQVSNESHVSFKSYTPAELP